VPMDFEDEPRNWWAYVIPVVVVAGLGAALYYGRKTREAPPEPPAQVAATATAPAPKVDNVIEPPKEAVAPLPSLQESDPSMLEGITQLFGNKLDSFIVPADVVRHIVVTIDNLPRRKTSVQLWPLKQTAGTFATAEAAGELTVDSRNYARYEPLMKMVRSCNVRQLAATSK